MLLCEGLLALFGGEIYSPPVYPGDVVPVRDATFDPLVGWTLPRSAAHLETTADYSVTYHTNSQGFRSPREFTPRADRRLIAFLGDSFTFGSGVEDDETFAALVEQGLDDTWSCNFGIGGFGIDQMWMSLRHYALPLKPDLVVLSFIRQDLDRSLSAYRKDHAWRQKPVFRLLDGSVVPMTVENRPSSPVRWLQQSSRLYRLWLRAESSLSRRHAIGYRWRLNRALFQEIRDECRRASVPLLVVHVPVNRRSPAPLFAREFAALGIDYLDLTPLLPADADALYYPRDHHFTAAGHRFAADAILAHLTARGWFAPGTEH